ncbi:hypothetical protein JOB18_020735 [Solea senegalensis]|uniref:Uncharacterized protein n=1 Tax=Solea senegalensis TaxID=28829 RepID=A0AAV6T6Q3_SOLSE|nr:hypothetical protein JOB18_020735 [Solea senegalensis]
MLYFSFQSALNHRREQRTTDLSPRAPPAVTELHMIDASCSVSVAEAEQSERTVKTKTILLCWALREKDRMVFQKQKQ